MVNKQEWGMGKQVQANQGGQTPQDSHILVSCCCCIAQYEVAHPANKTSQSLSSSPWAASHAVACTAGRGSTCRTAPAQDLKVGGTDCRAR
jgi:hypothetical protein